MKLEEIRAICENEGLSDGPWSGFDELSYAGINDAHDQSIAGGEPHEGYWEDNADRRFCIAARKLMPKLLVIAELAKCIFERDDTIHYMTSLRREIKDLENDS